jgi:hypothetical protein
MNYYAIACISCVLLVPSMLITAVLGHRLGRRRLLASPDRAEIKTGTVDAALLSLLGLLTAFTFSSAYSRYDGRRQLIVEEANAIGTAYLRLQLLPEERQSSLRAQFRRYVQTRLDLWEALPDREAALAAYDRSNQLQRTIWSEAVDATGDETHGDARKLLLPALNAMIDITTTRLIALQSHPPLIIFVMLLLLSLAATWTVGYGLAESSRISWPHVAGFAIVAALALYMILDIEFPRYGLVRLDMPHELFSDLLDAMP